MTRAEPTPYATPARLRRRGWRRRAAVLASALVLVVVAPGGGAEPKIPDLREIQRENDQLAGLIDEIDATSSRRAAEQAKVARRLARDELTLYGKDISAEALRQARLALDSVQSRAAVIQGRIEQRTLALERLTEQIAQLDQAIADAATDQREATVGDLRNEVARDLLATQAGLTERLIASYREALRGNRRYAALLGDRLRLLQSRLRLSELERAGLFEQDPRVPLLESVIADHLRRAARLMRSSAEPAGDEPAQQARRAALDLRLDDAVTRSFLRQNDLELILAGNALDDLRTLRRDELMPLHVLRGAERRVAAVDANLVQITAALDAQREVLHAKRAALARPGGEAALDLSLLDDLGTAMELQRADIEALRGQAAQEREVYERIIAERYAYTLVERRPLPRSAADWQRLADNALHLPQLLARSLSAVREELRAGSDAAGSRRNALLLTVALGLTVPVLWGARLLRRWSRAQAADSHLAVFARPLSRVLPALLPALLWLLVALVYEISAKSLVPILLLLLLPALLAFVLSLSRELLRAQAHQQAVHAEAADAATQTGADADQAPATATDRTPAAIPAAAPEPAPEPAPESTPESARQPAPEPAQADPAQTRMLQAHGGGADAAAAEAGTAPQVSTQGADDTAAAGSVRLARRRFHRKLRLGLLLATVIAALYILTRALPVAPILADLLDRLAMLGVLALALPAFALHGLFRGFATQAGGRRRRVPAALAMLSRLLPIFLVGVGLIGILGYINLAWALLTYLGWGVVVGLALAVVIGILADLRDRAVAHLAPEQLSAEPAADTADTQSLDAAARAEQVEGSDEAEDAAGAEEDAAAALPPTPVTDELADFWRTHFVEPGYRLGVLVSVLGAGWLLLRLWDWHADTPVVRWLLGLLNTPLFRLGESAFTVTDILLAVVLVASVFYVGGWSQQVSYNLAYRRVRDAGLRQALATFTQYVIIVAGVLLALRIIGFDITTLTVFAASLGVGIGFGLQNIINNFVSGVLLLAERPLKVGDFVSIGSNLGSVTRIGIRSLTMRTLDKQEVIIPNGSVISGEFTNWTRSDDLLRNVHYIRIRYEDDPELAIRLIERILRRHPHVLADPAPGVFLWEYSESSVDIRVQYCFRMNEGPGALSIRSEVLLAIGRSFREHGIQMPHAKRDVTMHLDDDSRGLLANLGAAKPGL